MAVAIFSNSSKIVSKLVQSKVSKDLEVDGLKVVLVNQSLVRYELVP